MVSLTGTEIQFARGADPRADPGCHDGSPGKIRLGEA